MTPKTPDYGHKEADKELTALVRCLHLSYRSASISLQEKLEKYLEKFEKEDKKMRALYDSGEMSHEDYMKWRMRKIAGTKQWKAMLNQLANDMTHQNEIAASMIDDTLPDVYAVNHNYGTFEAEKGSGYDTTYTMYDKHTVSRLLKENPDLLPEPTVNIPRDRLWNRQHLQSELLRGILTGASMREIAKRFQSVTDMTERSAMRNARTAVTGAENAGRIDSYKRAEKMGIKMKQMWMATLDGRTRDSHAMMDGEEQEVGKKFSNGCRYPGDPKGPPSEVYNCRCTLVAVVDGADPYNPNLRKSEYLEDQDLTYQQWKEMHGASPATNQKPEIRIEFVPAKTRQEAEEFAQQFAKNVDYSKISVENCNIINETFNELTTKYPIHELDKIGGQVGGRAVMSASYNTLNINRMAIGKALRESENNFLNEQAQTRKSIENIKSRYQNKKMPNDIQKNINNMEKQLKFKRWSVLADADSPLSGVVTHEYGHILSDQYFGMINREKANPNYNSNRDISLMNNKWSQVFDKARSSGDIFNLSKYGSTNVYEFFAESFAAKVLGIPLPDYVSELLDEVFENGIM